MKLLHVVLAVALAVFSAISFAQAIDINTATAEQLDKGVKGIGSKKAAAIVKYREANGPFQSVDDLAKVPGIKGKTLNKIKPMVTVGGAEPSTAPAAAPAAPAAAPAAPAAAPAAPAAAPAAPAMPAMPAMKPAVPKISTPPVTAPAPPAAPKQ